MPGIPVGAPMPDGSHAEKTFYYQVDRFANHLYHAGNGNDDDIITTTNGDVACRGERLITSACGSEPQSMMTLLDSLGQSLLALSDLSRCRLKTLV